MTFTNSIGQGELPNSNTMIAGGPVFDTALSNNCVIIGASSCDAGIDLINTTAIGAFCSTTAGTMTDCTFVGNAVMTNATGPLTAFTAVGSEAALNATCVQDGTYIGKGSGESDGGDFNTALGSGALSGAGGADGGHCIAIGYQAGLSWVGTGEADNIAIGHTGTAGDTGVINLGTQGTQTTCFVAGITGVTPAASPVQTVVIDANGQLGTGGGSAPFTWTTVTVDTLAVSGTGYVVASTVSPLTITLPVAPALYDEIIITGQPATNTGWIVDPGAGVGSLYFGRANANTLESTGFTDSIHLVCTKISGGINFWSVISSVGVLLVDGNSY